MCGFWEVVRGGVLTPPGRDFVAVLDNLGCLIVLLWGCLLALQCDLFAGFARLQGWVLKEMGRDF